MSAIDSPPRPRFDFFSLERIEETLEAVLESSPADETELVWFEVRRRGVTNRGRRRRRRPRHEKTILVRVHEGGRVGTHRTEARTVGEIEHAIRQAIAQSRIHQPIPGLPHLPADPQPTPDLDGLFDEQVAGLSARQAERIVGQARDGEHARLDWGEARVAVFNSRGVRRRAAVTSADLTVRYKPAPGSGRAEACARTLDRLAPEAVFDRARRHHAEDEPGELPGLPTRTVLAPEATVVLCDLLNRTAFTAHAYQDGSSFLREHLGIQVFDRRIRLYDDGTDPSGLPFPFDLEGTVKRRVELILDGTPKTPALDERKAAQLGLPATGHAITGGDARAENVFLAPGGQTESELLALADGGLWIGSLTQAECFDGRRMKVRSVAHGVRQIRNGELAEPLPDLLWEDSLLRVFSHLLGLGDETVSVGIDRGLSGGVTAPAIALADVDGLSLSPS